MLRTMKSLRGQTDAGYETRTLYGRDYYVVPVVAMVEGVRFGANQSSAELGLASEFGKFVEGWNNSPIVLGHPQVDGNFVSASSPSVLEEFCVGFMSGSRVDGDKLKCEAWLEIGRREVSEESKSVFTRVEEGTMIEVSVGFFTDVEEKKGRYNNKGYTGVWRNIVPDHLAFLAEGVLGACSIEDGCGTPRVNSVAAKVMDMFRADKSKKGKHKRTVSKYMNEGIETPEVQEDAASCACQGHDVEVQENAEQNEIREMVDVLAAVRTYSEKDAEVLAGLITQTLPADMLSGDVDTLLRKALCDYAGRHYVYLYGFTAQHALYNQYCENDGWKMLRVEYSISDAGVVSFTGEPQEVRLLTNIIPVEAAGDEPTANEVQTQENPMTTQTQEAAPAAPAAVVEPAAPAAPVAQTAPKALSAAEYIAQAPAEVREVLEASMKVHEGRKTVLVNKIKESERNTFTEEFLKAQSLETLESLASLANVTPTFEGVATPASRAQAADANAVPAAPKALSVKTEA